VVFQAVYDEIELQKAIMTSSPLRHQNNVTKIFYFGLSQSKFLATPVGKTESIWAKSKFCIPKKVGAEP